MSVKPDVQVDVETILDAETVAELRPVCDHRLRHKSGRRLGACDRPAAYVVRFALPCGCTQHRLLCQQCLGHLRNRWSCRVCDEFLAGVPAILSVEPIGGNR